MVPWTPVARSFSYAMKYTFTEQIRERRKKRARDLRAFWTSFNVVYQTIILGFIMWVYILMGAGVFVALEAQEEQNRIDATQATRERLINNLTITFNATRDEIEHILDGFSTACDQGLLLNNRAPLWQFGSACFFALTVVTTIGYGKIAPSTTSGRVFCVFYALVGIPLCVILLAIIGKLLLKIAKLLYSRFKHGLILIRLIGVLVVMVSGSALLGLIPAVILSHIEQWDFSTSIYYIFVSFSTIGFGDFVAAQQVDRPGDAVVRSLYTICLAFWLFIGLAYVAIILGGIRDVMKKTWKRLQYRFAHRSRKLKKRKSKDADSGAEISAVDDCKTHEGPQVSTREDDDDHRTKEKECEPTTHQDYP